MSEPIRFLDWVSSKGTVMVIDVEMRDDWYNKKKEVKLNVCQKR